MTEPVRKLLGGYATGSLTPEEEKTLFAAAVQDQEVFNLLAEEQVLRDHLADPVFRSELLLDLEQSTEAARPLSVREPRQWIGWTFAGMLAVATVVIFTVTLIPREEKQMVAKGSLPQSVVRVFQPPRPAPKVPVPVASLAPPPSLPASAMAPSANLLSKIQTAPPVVASAAPLAPLKVAVLDFDSGKEEPKVGQSLSRYLSDQLATNRAYSVVDRERVANAIAERGKDALLNREAAAQIGRAVGADAVLMGHVSNAPGAVLPPANHVMRVEKLSTQPAVSASLIDSATGKTIRMAKTSAHPDHLEAAAVMLEKALELRATVTDVNGGIVTLDIGAKTGVKAGDRFRLFRAEEALGEVTITTAKETFAVGKYAGAKKPQPGDRAVVISH